MFFLLWRALKGKLPTNEKLSKFGHDPKECCCCYNLEMDIVEHICLWLFARNMWKFFVASCGINSDFLPLHYYIMKLWDAEYKNKAHKLFLQAAPIYICWNLWKNRCASTYAGKRSNLVRVKFLVFKDTFFLMKIVYPYICWPTN